MEEIYYPTEFSYIQHRAKREISKKNWKRDNRSIEKSTSRRGARQHVYDYLKSHPCIKCGESDPRVLQFNHINPDEKLETVSNIMRRGLTQVMKEIEKCEVLCANCHSKHTADQQNWYKDLII